jgi:RimJ/RimL family protein N-acetyltransferase
MINSDKYTLQLLSNTDSISFYTLIQSNKSRLEDFFAGTIARTETLESTQAYCKVIEKRIAQKEYYPYLIVDNETKDPVGLIDVKNIDWNIPKGELGAFIDAKYEGKGLVTHFINEVILNIVESHKFKKLYCRVSPHNERSVRVVERLGFELEGKLRRDYKTTKGELVDLNYYGRLFD